MRDVLIGTRKEVRRYIEQPAAAKVLSHISTEAEARPKISWDKFYTGFFDGLHPVKKVTDALAKLQGKELTTEKNAYLLSRLFAGWVGKANHFLGDRDIRPEQAGHQR